LGLWLRRLVLLRVERLSPAVEGFWFAAAIDLAVVFAVLAFP
jgi:hypothetical protein